MASHDCALERTCWREFVEEVRRLRKTQTASFNVITTITIIVTIFTIISNADLCDYRQETGDNSLDVPKFLSDHGPYCRQGRRCLLRRYLHCR